MKGPVLVGHFLMSQTFSKVVYYAGTTTHTTNTYQEFINTLLAKIIHKHITCTQKHMTTFIGDMDSPAMILGDT